MSEDRESREAAPSEAAPPRQTGIAVTLVVVAFAVSTLLAELLLRVVWNNPFVNETTDYLIKLERNHLFRDLVLDRSTFDSEHPRVRYRTSARSYIMPSEQFENPQATVAFSGPRRPRTTR